MQAINMRSAKAIIVTGCCYSNTVTTKNKNKIMRNVNKQVMRLTASSLKRNLSQSKKLTGFKWVF